jgi:hypothetical protein
MIGLGSRLAAYVAGWVVSEYLCSIVSVFFAVPVAVVFWFVCHVGLLLWFVVMVGQGLRA